jgi:hypothetical protein
MLEVGFLEAARGGETRITLPDDQKLAVTLPPGSAAGQPCACAGAVWRVQVANLRGISWSSCASSARQNPMRLCKRFSPRAMTRPNLTQGRMF